MPRRSQVRLIAYALVTFGAAAANAAPFEVGKGSQVSFVAHITGGSFVAKSDSIKGTVDYDPNKKTLSGAEITADAASFETGMSLRDKHMRDKYLQASKYPAIIFKAAKDGLKFTGEKAKLKGVFVIKGVEKPVELDLQVKGSGPNFTADATFPLNITDYGIAQPKFAMVKMEPIIEISLNLVLSPKK